jgi:AcrR family transcriptional regulator
MSQVEGPRTRRPRADGERSRRAILDAAARLATVEGLDGLSIGRLADHVGMSKSGLYAHFGSKEELQLATIEAANAIFVEDVVAPALAATTPLERLEALCERFLSHVERAVFPGGCFFASVAAELDTRPGPVRDRAAEVVVWWSRLHHTAIVEAQAVGELDPAEDAAQLSYEIGSLLLFANASYLLGGGADALERGRRGIARRLELARPPVAGPA